MLSLKDFLPRKRRQNHHKTHKTTLPFMKRFLRPIAATAAALKKIFDKVNRGDPAVVYDQRITNDPADHDTPFQFLERKTGAKENYITHDQLQDVATLINAFDAEIGIPSAPYQKKERMVTSEAESRQVDSRARLLVWKDCLDRSMEEVNKMFPALKLSCELRNNGEGDGADVTDDVNDNQL